MPSTIRRGWNVIIMIAMRSEFSETGRKIIERMLDLKALRPLAIVLICLNPPCVAAHHSDAGYDHDVIVAFEGIVTRYTWRNPHVHVFIQTTDDYGERVIWKIETGSTPILTRSGWTPESLERGDRVSVRAHPERHRERKEAILLSLEKADSSVLTQKDIRPQPPVAASGFSGTWKGRPSEDGPFKERLVNLALTEAGALARDQYDIATENPLSECIAYPTPRLVDSSSYVFEIEQLDDRMYIRSEYLDAARTVYLDTRGHPEDGERTIQGHSMRL